jgi:flagellin
MQLLNIVNRTSAAQTSILQKLSTGLKINKASDNPAGLIAMNNFDAQLTAVNASLDNNQRTDAMLNTAESAIGEINGMLLDIEKLALASVNDSSLSQAEIAANQSQIDSALSAIDRLVNTTEFNGKQLLNGSQSIQTTGVTANKVSNLRVYSQGNSPTDTTVTVTLNTLANSATGTFAVGGATLNGAHEIVITGSLGSQTISLASATTVANIVTAIQNASASTGVDAVNAGSNNIRLESSSVGSSASIQMKVLSGGALTDVARTVGVDAKVQVNGSMVTADGKDVSYNANGLSLQFDVGTAFTAAAQTSSFTVKANTGMQFQLGADSTTRATLGLDSLASFTLGGGDASAYLSDLKSGGTADLASGSANTLKAVRKAITQVSTARGRIGGFQKFQVQTSIRSLTAAQESLSAAKSVVADTDYAAASAELNRQSVLLNSGMSLLGLANQQSAQILSLLGG